MSNPKVVTVVAVALVRESGDILLAQRPEGKAMAGLWEFPGGKLEIGETPEQALVRELKEELGITVTTEALKPFTFVSHSYPNFHLLMPLYMCRAWQGELTSREGQAFAWAEPDALKSYPMPEADLPLIAEFQARLSKKG